MKSDRLTRAELAQRLRVSIASIDRLLAAGYLRACGRRGRAKVYRLTDARRAMAQSAKASASTPYGQAAISLLSAQAREAQARAGALRAEYTPRSEWAPLWLEEVEVVRETLTAWIRKGAPARVAALVASGALPWQTFADVQEREARPLLDAIAERLEETPAEHNGHRNGHHRRGAPPVLAGLAAAKASMMLARAQTVELRASIAGDPAWRKRGDVRRELAEARARAREVIWQGIATAIARLAEGASPTVDQVAAALRALVGEAMSALREPLGGAPGRRKRGASALARR
jgi:hypothetical protein